MTVVLFGLFHGLVYLPVILSWVGPSPYPTHAKVPVDPADSDGREPVTHNGHAGKHGSHAQAVLDANKVNK